MPPNTVTMTSAHSDQVVERMRSTEWAWLGYRNWKVAASVFGAPRYETQPRTTGDRAYRVTRHITQTTPRAW